MNNKITLQDLIKESKNNSEVLKQFEEWKLKEEEHRPDGNQIVTKDGLLEKGIAQVIPHDHGSAIHITFSDGKYVILQLSGFYDRDDTDYYQGVTVYPYKPESSYLRRFFDIEKSW